MLRKAVLILIFCSNSIEQSDRNDKLTLKVTPEQVLRTFDDIMSDGYIQLLAKKFAAKAARYFLSEINKQKEALTNKTNSEQIDVSERSNSPLSSGKERKDYNNKQLSEMIKIANAAAVDAVKAVIEESEDSRFPVKKSQQNELKDVSQMLDAVNDASTEAVKLELDENEAYRLIEDPSPDGDHLESSGEISHEEHKKIPVVRLTKINGKFFRRFLII